MLGIDLAQAAEHIDAETTQHLWLAVAQLVTTVVVAGIGAFGLVRASRAARAAEANRVNLEPKNGHTLAQQVNSLIDMTAAGQERRAREHQKLEDLMKQLLTDMREEDP